MNKPSVFGFGACVVFGLLLSYLVACSASSPTATVEPTRDYQGTLTSIQITRDIGLVTQMARVTNTRAPTTPEPAETLSPTNMPVPNSTLEPSTTTTPQVFCMECPCTESVAVEVWVDQNVNGTREPEEPPLEGVRFRGEYCVVSCGKTCVESRFTGAISDADGYAEIWMDGCCGGVVLSPEVPPDYKLTTSDHCCSYGFAPLDTRTPIATPSLQPTPTIGP